ncbi:MAG: hypothetical protein K0Q43_1234 [Ramlibacter sp.]|jgi:hypothetical protein|nr:hypothetical protein [Ramlibacter sp.]
MAHQSIWRLPQLERSRDAAAADEGPGLMVSPAFWLGGLFSVGLWTALAWALTS